VKAFVQAFGNILDPRRVSVNVFRFSEDGAVIGFVETGEASLTDTGELEVPESSMPPGNGEVLISTVFVDSRIIDDGGPGDSATPGVATFYYGFTVEDDDYTRARPEEARVSVTIDSEKLNTAGGGDKHARRALEDALRDWERLTGDPIVEYQSGRIGGPVFPYGFTLPD
jgi:tryptophan synthase beta subunit